MAAVNETSFVSAYTSPVETSAEIVRKMLIANDISATVAELSGPFSGLLVAPSEVIVWQEDEAQAKSLVAQAQSHHRDRLGNGVSGPGGAGEQ